MIAKMIVVADTSTGMAHGGRIGGAGQTVVTAVKLLELVGQTQEVEFCIVATRIFWAKWSSYEA